MKKLTAVLAVTGVVFGITAPALAGGASVRVVDNRFRAQTVHISRGATVTWRWAGRDAHDVKGKGFHSRIQKRGSFSHRFTTRGTFHYVCTLHSGEGMRGTVIVG